VVTRERCEVQIAGLRRAAFRRMPAASAEQLAFLASGEPVAKNGVALESVGGLGSLGD
jgi:hypothetical protein